MATSADHPGPAVMLAVAADAGFVGDRYHDASDGVSSLQRYELPRVHRTTDYGSDAGRQGLLAAAGLHRADGHHLGHGPCRFQPLHRRLPTVQSRSSLYRRAGASEVS